jgi:uncharacterized protein (TIRG00374 family)
MTRRRINLGRHLPTLIMVVALIGLVFIVADWGQIRTAVTQASWRPLPYALAATALSYTCISLNFALVSRLLGVDMRSRDLAVVGFVSVVLNHLISAGGAAGYSVRYLLMRHHDVSMRQVIAISILHFLLTSLIMIAMLPVGLVFLGLKASISRVTGTLLTAAALLVILWTSFATLLVFWDTMRRKVVNLLASLMRTLFRRDVSESLERFESTLALGVQAMKGRPSLILAIMLLVAFDWALSLVALWFCFRAFGTTPSVGQAISGFVIGTVAGVASLIPGGLGVQEASMAGIFALFGISFERAVLASVLFRVIYTIIPYGVSLGLYRLVLRRRGDGYPDTEEVNHENPGA